MTRKSHSFLLLSIFVLISLFFSGYSHSTDQNGIRVRVSSDEDKILLNIKSSYKIEAINSGMVLNKGKRIKNKYIVPTNSGLKLGDEEFKIYGIKIIPKKDATIYLGRKRFRGVVDIIRTKEMKLLVINHLDIEKYLYGVLHHEIPYYWPTEALKAQAIAARSFAMYRIKLNHDKDYDVTSDIYSQVYGGRSGEKWRTKRAVDLTKGKILTYKNDILPAYYHSKCGGHTENVKEVFDIGLHPLKGRTCRYCSGARHLNWKASLSYKDIEKRLNKYGIKAKNLSFIKEGKRNKSGRLENIKIKDSDGVKEIKGYKFRLALGPNTIKSTNFRINVTKKGVIFKGKGWGHGVGMCQWGVFGMAKRRRNYKDILEFYYPGAKLANIKKQF